MIRLITFFLLCFFAMNNPVWACLCFSTDNGPLAEAQMYNTFDIILKGTVVDFSEKPTAENDVFAEAIIRPVEIYNGEVTNKIKVLDHFRIRKNDFMRPCPDMSIPLKKDSTYTLGLKYSDLYQTYIKANNCGKLPVFKYHEKIRKISKIENLPHDPMQGNFEVLKTCKKYFSTETEDERKYFQSASTSYLPFNLKNPARIIDVDAKTEIIDELFFSYKKDGAIVGRGKNKDLYFFECEK